MTSLNDSTTMLLNSSPTSYNTKSAYEAGLVVDAPTMNKTDVEGYIHDRTFKNMFPPVCLKSHWDPELYSKHVLPGDLRIPLPVDPRPLVRNCTMYYTTAQEEVNEDKVKRAQVDLSVRGGGPSRIPFELYTKNINIESTIFLDHPLDKCDENKWLPSEESDLYKNQAAPPRESSRTFTELSRPLATIVTPYKCRAEADELAWEKSARLFNNVTREDRIGGNLPRASEALLARSTAAITAKASSKPRVWPTNSVVFFVASGDGGYLLYRLALAFVARKYEVTIFCNCTAKSENGVSYFPNTQYVPNDIYTCVIMWGYGLLLSNYQYLPNTRVLLLVIDHDVDICQNEVKTAVDKIVVHSAFHRSLYNCYPWSKYEVIPNGLPVELFLQNKNTPRERFRVLVTEYNKHILSFVKDAWYRIVSTYPEAELHIWSKVGDNKKELEPYLSGGKGVVLHGEGSLEQLIVERFRSSVHLQLNDRVSVSNDSLRLSALAGCIPIMPSIGVNTELSGVNVDGDINKTDTLIEYAKAVSAVFKDQVYSSGLRNRLQGDNSLKGWNATCDRWIKVIEGLKKTKVRAPYNF
jgi:hypothetical protein